MKKRQCVIITGASSGIGEAAAQVFSKAGYSLGLIARNLSAMEKLALPHSVCVSADVTDHQALREAIQKIQNELGEVDCLINNAGVGESGDFTEIAHQENEKMVDVNIMGVINGIEAVLPSMRTRKHGTIINISSLADRKSRPNTAVYAATKAAVKSLSESLRTANAKYGIRICNISPSKILTPMLITDNLDNIDTIDVEDFAKAILWVYQQPQGICIRDMVVAPTTYEA